MNRAVRVFLTVDTEVWPQSSGWPHVPLTVQQTCERELNSYFWGGEGKKRLGVPYQLEVFRRYGLKASFFVDPLFSFALGLEPLRSLVRVISGAHQEIGLHLHPEWLTDPRCSIGPSFRGPLLNAYPEEDQATLVRVGLQRLAEAGAGQVCAFRAGSWGANLATLRILRSNSIRFDTSLNSCFPQSFPDLPDREERIQPGCLEGVWEFPVTYFVDSPPDHKRPLHVCACSYDEFELALEHAYLQRWSAIVIVAHSFEFVRVSALEKPGASAGPQRLLERRFERLCRFLHDNRNRFLTHHFSDWSDFSEAPGPAVKVAISSYSRTLGRHLGQFVSRIY